MTIHTQTLLFQFGHSNKKDFFNYVFRLFMFLKEFISRKTHNHLIPNKFDTNSGERKFRKKKIIGPKVVKIPKLSDVLSDCIKIENGSNKTNLKL